jgi:hypothetical protein
MRPLSAPLIDTRAESWRPRPQTPPSVYLQPPLKKPTHSHPHNTHLRPLPAGRTTPSPPTPAGVVVGGSSVEACSRVVAAAAAFPAPAEGMTKPCVRPPAAARARAHAWTVRRVDGMLLLAACLPLAAAAAAAALVGTPVRVVADWKGGGGLDLGYNTSCSVEGGLGSR